ncbi:hypothetical protein F4560_003248 [Saccharothrix ecbatanensis]|uniref:Uncharacterized protein n=1 Tax=Saccharothrix ecbatanensis TaxID=1105145 RepID=A0A7W9HJX4_9PSEU|nr:hypothetical protein [Saccharothrix ecbatanensis]
MPGRLFTTRSALPNAPPSTTAVNALEHVERPAGPAGRAQEGTPRVRQRPSPWKASGAPGWLPGAPLDKGTYL